ncbi:MAG: VWA-like domain-containing protein [Pseudomonadota bacterium]
MIHSKRIQPALARLPEVDPAIAALALWCNWRDDNGPTRTTGDTILVGPEFQLLPISEQTGLAAHHVLHVALRHSARRAAAAERYGSRFQARLFDLASDALVNEALLQAHHALPRPCVRANEIAERLPSEDRPANLLAEWDCDRLYVVLANHATQRSGTEDDPVEAYMQAQGFAPDLDGSDPDHAEPEIWAGRVEQALQAGQRAGSGIGAVLARFGDLPQARVPWEVRLRRLLGKALLQEPRPSHRRPSRVWLARDSQARQDGTIQPAFDPAILRNQRRPRLVVALDTSSSIRDVTLELFASEALSILRRTGAEAHLLGFDTEVHSAIRLRSASDLQSLDLKRGGGTDFGPVLAEAEALDPSLIIVLTDLDAPTPSRIRAPLIWAVPTEPAKVPETGDVLVMNDVVALSRQSNHSALTH